MGFALVGTSVPTFWLGLVLIYRLFRALEDSCRRQDSCPSPRTRSPICRAMVLPSFALGIYLAGPLARFIRSRLIEILQAQFVTTARAKGLGETHVMRGHALKNALIPTVTFRRAAGRRSARRRHRHRGRLQPAGYRFAGAQRHPEPRFPGRAGGGAGRCLRLCADQHRGRHHLCPARPTD